MPITLNKPYTGLFLVYTNHLHFLYVSVFQFIVVLFFIVDHFQYVVFYKANVNY